MPHEQLYLDAIEDRRKVIYEPIQLRPYQEKIVEEVENTRFLDDKTVVALATGGGKSVIAAELAKRFTAQGESVAVLTAFSALIEQLSRHLSQMGIEHNIVKAGMHDWEPGRKVHLIMEQSYHSGKREELKIKVDTIIKDEAHYSRGKRNQDVLNALDPNFTVELSATPLDEKGYLLCDKSQVITHGQASELISQGYLAKPKYFIPKWTQKQDYSNVRTSGNDYSEVALREIIDTPEFTNQAIAAMDARGSKEKQTAVFCCGIEHAESFCKALKDAGYNAEVIHSKLGTKVVEERIKAFKKGDINCICSVNQIATGFDYPELEQIVLLRPTRIYRYYIQMVGRVLRKAKGKEYGEILDLAQCVSSLGFVEEPMPLIEPGDRKSLAKVIAERERPIIDSMIGEEPTEVSFDFVVQKVEELKRKQSDPKSMSVQDLIATIDTTTDPMVLIRAGFELHSRVHGTFYKKSTPDWAAELWVEMIEEFPENHRLTMTLLRNRMKKIIKDRKKDGSIYRPASIYHFATWVLKESELRYQYRRYEFADEGFIADDIDIDDEIIPF